jgi:hypothetical protein
VTDTHRHADRSERQGGKRVVGQLRQVARALVGIGARSSVDDVAAVVSEGGGRMPAFKEIHGAARRRSTMKNGVSPCHH